jgi:hypothetical protein
MLTLPTVFNDALSYDEQVCKLTQAINEMATTINGLPDYIIELVKELLDQMNLEEIVKQVLADYFFINVKNPPAPLVAAKGDGVTDDTVAIQAMINYVNGKSNYLFFPAGTYSVQGLTMVPGVSLIGMDRYKTIVMLRAASNKDLLSGDLGNCTIANVTLNANMPGQTANCSIYSGNATDMLISDVIFKNGYDMLSINNDGIVQMDNVVFDGTQGNGLAIGGVRASVNNINFVNNSKLNAGTLISITGNNNSIVQILNTEYAENGIVIAGDNNVVEGWMSETTMALSDSGVGNAINLYTGRGRIVKNINWNETDSGNKIVNVGGQSITTVNGKYQTIANAGYQEDITGSKVENISNNYTLTVGSSCIETITGTKKITAKKVNLTGDEKTTVSGLDVQLNPTNPLTYNTPTTLDKNFKSIKFKDPLGTPYDVLVYNGELNLEGDFANIVDYGAIAEQDCTEAIRAAFASEKGIVYIPRGNWLLNGTVTITNKNVICDGNISYTGSDKFAFIVTANNLWWKGGVVACRSTNVTADVYGFLLALNYNPTTKTCEWGIKYTMTGVSMWGWEYAVVGMQNFNCRFEMCSWNTGGAFYGLNFMNGTHDDNIYNGHTTFANCYFVESKRYIGDTKERALVVLASPKEYYFDNVSFETCPYAVNIFRSDSVLLNNIFNLCHFEGITKNAFASIPINDPYNRPYDRAYAVNVNWTNTFCRPMPGKMSSLNQYWNNTIEDVPWIENGGTVTQYYKDLVSNNTSTYPVMGKRAQWGGHSFPIERVFPDLSAIDTKRTNCKTITLNASTKTLRYSTFNLFGFDGSTNGGLHYVKIYAYAYNTADSLYGVYEGCVFATGKGFITTIKEVKTNESITDFTITGSGGNDQLDINMALGNTYTNATIFITGNIIGVQP